MLTRPFTRGFGLRLNNRLSSPLLSPGRDWTSNLSKNVLQNTLASSDKLLMFTLSIVLI